MNTIVPIQRIASELAGEIVGDRMVPHITSHPLLRMAGDRPVITAFATITSADDIREGCLRAPSIWIDADIVNGEVLGTRESSSEPGNIEEGTCYNVTWTPEFELTEAYFVDSYGMLDDVRSAYAETGTLDTDLYSAYFDRIVATIPPAYRRFYVELGGNLSS